MENVFAKTDTSDAEVVCLTRAEYEELVEQIHTLMEENQNLDEQCKLLKSRLFGSSSEKASKEAELPYDQYIIDFEHPGRYLIFDGSKVPEPKVTEVAAHSRRQRTKDQFMDNFSNVPRKYVEHDVPEDERICPTCGSEMEPIGQKTHEELVIIPAQLYVRVDIYPTYACANCKENSTDTPVVATSQPPRFLPGSYASPEAVAHLMVQKFVMGSPLYRQEQFWFRSGVMLSRQTMSNWMLNASFQWLDPICDRFRQDMLLRDILHADETTLQVLHEKGKTPQSLSYYWLFRTTQQDLHPRVVFIYSPDRRGTNAVQFLDGYSGWLHVDGFCGYHRLPENIRLVGCWAHVRRKFNDAYKILPKDKRPGSLAEQGLRYCQQLFSIEKQLAGLSPEERHERRLILEKPLLDEIEVWANTKVVSTTSTVGRAINYLKNQWVYLCRYLEDGRLEISNNLAERSVRSVVVARKAFLFANTSRGAHASATIFSIIETAIENGLDPYRYLVYIFENAPRAQEEDPAHWVDNFMPEVVPDSCRADMPYKPLLA